MPLTLKPPRKGKTPYWSVRGTHLGVSLDRSTGLADRAKAAKVLAKWRDDIERGALSRSGEPTFLSAALDYIKTGGEARFIGKRDDETGEWSGLIAHFGEKPLREIDQVAIDKAAVTLYPNGTPQTRNRQVHSPVSAILKSAGIEFEVKRPKGWRGKKGVDWLKPEQAFAAFAAAGEDDEEFGILVITFVYTGLRLSELLTMPCSRVELPEAFAYVPDTKNGEPRAVHLPPVVVAALGRHPRGMDRDGTVFRFRKSGHLYQRFQRVFEAAGITLPPRVGFHIFRHTYATWMRRYGGLDVRGLVGTGAWKDEESASRYAHVVPTEEARRSNLLPTPNTTRTRGKRVDSATKRPQKPRKARNA